MVLSEGQIGGIIVGTAVVVTIFIVWIQAASHRAISRRHEDGGGAGTIPLRTLRHPPPSYNAGPPPAYQPVEQPPPAAD
ncbi:uncharacterized protein K452DRAFT_301598 [Aplosporella prunicola CBS 121167]|uniref:Uncharacterized protein n=1 Tax=Aplosporella prunicola CBS 121167 TaxID=1176127 RepID=A0A6A6B3B9_9PEZI|nr:uncharacterized protein K452DRAFT_301598 [Aplosporella prunicola CBS 121167]KAF2137873.1 hypothetical protein K452DRAFT_301598 [Aplosporella prunicola CBS 121167]